jgi:hypothetical protein
MAGHGQSSAVTLAPKSQQRTVKRRNRNARTYGELMRMARDNGVSRLPGQTAPQVLQEVLDRCVANWRWACDQLDNLEPEEFWVVKVDAQGNILTEPCKWYRLERSASEEVERVAGLVASLGISERLVQVEEAKAVLLVKAVRDAALDAGLDDGQVKALGSALRERLAA